MSRFKQPIHQKESIKTCVRLKPIISPNQEKVFYPHDSHTIVAKTGAKFTFNHIFDDKSSTDYIYEVTTKPIVQQALRGFNGILRSIIGCIMAYGQTCSGKTHTMKGTLDSPGIVPLALSDLFETIKIQEISARIQVSYMEIYNEKVFDLLADSNNIEVQIQNNQNNLFFNNLKEHRVDSFEKALDFFNKGQEKRKFASNNLNVNSSRSHTIFRISIKVCLENFQELKAQVDLVDLAGSQSLEKTKNQKISRTQGENINKSLLALSKIITLLSERKQDKYISFRESKLTRILQKSLCQNSKSSIICMISPNESNFQESMNTLKFGQKALTIKIQARQNVNRTEEPRMEPYLGKKNFMPSEKIELEEARQTIKQNQFYIRELNGKVSELEHQNYKLFTSLTLLQRQHNDRTDELKMYKDIHENQAEQWWKCKQMLQNRIKNYEEQIDLQQVRYEEVKRQLRTVEKNQKSLVESLAHYQNQCKLLQYQIKDIASQLDQETSKASRRKSEKHKEPLFKEKNQQKKKNPFHLEPFRSLPQNQRIQPNKLAWVFRLKNQVIELSRKVHEYAKANIEIAQEVQQLRLKIDELEEKREKQVSGKINPQALEYQEIKKLKKKITSLKEQLRLAQVNQKKYRDILKKESTRNLVQMEEYEEWYEKKYGGCTLTDNQTQTLINGNISQNLSDNSKIFEQTQMKQKMQIEERHNPFMMAVNSPSKSQRLNNSGVIYKAKSPILKNENPESMNQSLNKKISYGQSISKYENSNFNINQKPQSYLKQSMEQRDSMLLEDISSENQDHYQENNQNVMRANSRSGLNNSISNLNEENIQNQQKKSGKNFFEYTLQKKKEQSRDFEI